MNDTLRVLVADDDPQMQIAVTAGLSRRGDEIVVVPNGKEALARLESETFDLIITDQRMPEMTGLELLEAVSGKYETPVIMITAHGTIDQAVVAMQAGAADFVTKPFSIDELIRVVERVVSPENKEFRKEAKRNSRGYPIISNDPTMIRMLEVAEAVSRSDATVLVQGESGTGKELIARLIHTSSPRSTQPFVAVNCAALPANLLESELFGHEKGAFTGAQQRKIGKFELAHGGTILLDEISEMELPLQAKLLRVLQEREVDRVGGSGPVPIDVRVVATTNRDIQKSVEKGEFRADLYFRLNVIPLTLPSLRHRKGDIPLLIQHFMKKFLGKNAPEIPAAVLGNLAEYHWPGNIRELQNAVERAGILAQGRTPSTTDFLLQTGASDFMLPVENIRSNSVSENFSDTQATEQQKDGVIDISGGVTVYEMERRLILETLKITSDNRTQAAKMLGISIRTLRNKLNEYQGEEQAAE